MTLKTSSSRKELCLSKYQNLFLWVFFSTNNGYCFLTSFFLPMSGPPVALGFPRGAETISLPCGTWGSVCTPPSLQPEPFDGRTVELLPFVPLNNFSPSKAQCTKFLTLPHSSEWFLKQPILCKNSGN